MPVFEYTVDDEEQTTSEHKLTARQILTNAGIDVDTHYLVEIQGDHQISFQNDMDKDIHMHPKLKFIAIFTGVSPVS